METRTYTCIKCPRGCQVTAALDADGRITQITGNSCPRGAEYVTNELTDPRRIVTSLVRVSGGERPVVPVKTAGDIPKGDIFECVRILKNIQLTAPVRLGDVVAADVCGSGIDVVATADVDAAD